jgi:hypothetical protein
MTATTEAASAFLDSAERHLDEPGRFPAQMVVVDQASREGVGVGTGCMGDGGGGQQQRRHGQEGVDRRR